MHAFQKVFQGMTLDFVIQLQYEDPNPESIYYLYMLLKAVGHQLDAGKGKKYMDIYFRRIEILASKMKLHSRHRFMLQV